MLNIEIDEYSGFCFGVTTAIKKAEEELQKGGTLYCLGDIVHNSIECDRLKRMGLVTIDHDTLKDNCVTLRNRDTMEQERVSIDSLVGLLADKVSITGTLKTLK